MLFKIVSVDHHGWNGRDNHPQDSDIGLLVSPIRMTSWAMDADTQLVDTYDETHDRVTDEGRDAGRYETADANAGVVIRMWYCITPDGRVLELVDDEIELHRS